MLLSQAANDAIWAEPAAAKSVSACHQAKMVCNEVAQAPGSSPSSEASCAMEYSCSLPATPAAKEQRNPGTCGSDPVTIEGWFAKCRGCGCMTAHEKMIRHTDVPFCRRCQHTLSSACPAMQQKMVETLLYVHEAWSNAGL